jgi:hypothetical protein
MDHAQVTPSPTAGRVQGLLRRIPATKERFADFGDDQAFAGRPSFEDLGRFLTVE